MQDGLWSLLHSLSLLIKAEKLKSSESLYVQSLVSQQKKRQKIQGLKPHAWTIQAKGISKFHKQQRTKEKTQQPDPCHVLSGGSAVLLL